MWKKTDEVIDRWNRKTMLSQGIMQKELKVINRTVLNQISQLLSDRQRLVKRTQLKRTSAKTFGAALYAKKTTVPTLRRDHETRRLTLFGATRVRMRSNRQTGRERPPTRERRRRKSTMRKYLMTQISTINSFEVRESRA